MSSQSDSSRSPGNDQSEAQNKARSATLQNPHLAPRTEGTPAHALHPALRLVPVPVPAVTSDEEWSAQRVALIDTGRLHAAEATMADLLPLARRGTFVGGRLAIREALATAMARGDIPPVFRNARGAPVLPPGVTGSITHKRDLALAAVIRVDGTLRHLGLDLEQRPSERDLEKPSIASRILTANERAELASERLDALAERERVHVAFAVKEAVYKAIDPVVQRYVGFTEVELIVDALGTAEVSLLLPEPQVQELRVDAHWYVDGDWIVATAFAHDRSGR